MAGPAIVIVAGVYTTVLAVRSDDGLVAEDYYKRGLAINQVLAREQRARDEKISAEIDFAGGRLSATVRAGTALPPALRLRVIHPTRAGEDREIPLAAQGGGHYAGVLPALSHEARRLVLEDAAGAWRISGTLDKAGGSAQLDAAH